MEDFLTLGGEQTKKAGALFAKKILGKGFFDKKTIVIGLTGNLGGGKTTFVQGFAKGLGIEEKILSPTFVLARRFLIPKALGSKARALYHIDCYRMKNPKELLDIGFEKMISGAGNIVIAEWADRVKKIFPKDAFMVDFLFLEENKRRIRIKWGKQ